MSIAKKSLNVNGKRVSIARAAGLARKAFDDMGLKNSLVAPAGMKQ